MRPLRLELPPDRPRLSDANLRCISKLIQEEAGIVLSEEKSSLVMSRLGKRLNATRLANFDEYCRFVSSVAGAEERRNMLRALTTNVTRFYREAHHFEDLQNRVLPALQPQMRRGLGLRIWSAACSSGEEPYSIALSLLGALPDAAHHDVKILATDIDTEMLQRARTGVYARHSVSNIPDALAAEHLEPAPDGPEGSWSVRSSLRKLISFKELNLLRPWPMKGKFHAIFCRNVFIYFNRDTQEMITERFAQVLHKGGTLYLGHSERMSGTLASRFEYIGHSCYKLKY